jgi:glycosyltransferase involved in cell wall biosynthesis
LHYNAFNLRKGFPEVFKAFTKEFKKDEPVRLVLKTTLDEIPLPITKDQYPNIDIIRGKKPVSELVELCNQCDCFVFPSRGEGFGMTPLEAMATGIPAIVPNAHGISEYFDANFMYEVKVKEECPAIYSRYKGMDVGKMVICDEEDLRKQMRWIYEHQQEARTMGIKAAEYAKQWTYKKSAEKLKAILDEALKMNLKQRPLKNALSLELVQ